ncbi:MAG: conjugal transfer protein TraD [Proteobacteria bacterium]|nr:conjugal transfer protein TraD [Pseudomonadota bacterium]
MNTLELASYGFRRARTRSLVQLGGLIAKSGLLETFQLTLGEDFQRDPKTRDQIAALFKGFLVLNEIAQSEDVSLRLWTAQGLEALAKQNMKN